MPRYLKKLIVCVALSSAAIAALPSCVSAGGQQDASATRPDSRDADALRVKPAPKKTRSAKPPFRLPAQAASGIAAPGVLGPGTSVPPASAVGTTGSNPALAEPRATNAFDGFYVLASVGFHNGFGASESSAGYGYLASGYVGAPDYDPSTFSYTRLSGYELGLSAGFNKTVGNTLVGIEVSGRYEPSSNQKKSGSVSYAGTLPASYPAGVVSGTYSYLTGYSSSGEIERTASVDVAGRLGTIIEDWLLFGKFGAGASLFQARQTTTRTDRTCVNPTINPPPAAVGSFVPGSGSIRGSAFVSTPILGCESSSDSATLVNSVKRTALLPYLTFGGGFERNIGDWFFRGDFSVNTYLPMDNSLSITATFATYSAHVGLGYRF